MITKLQLNNMINAGRTLEVATSDDKQLGFLQQLPGVWSNKPNLEGRGWNMIALPFAAPASQPYRLLLNQYNEVLRFTLVDKAVPNRGITQKSGVLTQTDQLVVALDYEQSIKQIAAEDFPVSGVAGGNGLAIHHEPGLWLQMANEVTDGLNMARLSTIPHGDSVLAMGRGISFNGPLPIPKVDGLPTGVPPDLTNPYLAPYKHFHDSPFLGLFDPTDPSALLVAANAGETILKTTQLTVDTTTPTGGISNIPFIVKQANAVSMKSTFWIQELDRKGADGKNVMRLQYLQIVMLDFFDRRDGHPGLIGWPHVSINTMEKVSNDPLANIEL